MRKYLPLTSLLLLMVYINFVLGCTYYKVTTADTIAPVAAKIEQNSRYFIVHQGSYAWHLTNIALDTDKEELTGKLETLSDKHLYYLTTKPTGPNQYKAGTDIGTSPTYEVHFYVTEYLEDQNGLITIPLTSIEKIEIYDSDTGANTASTVFTALGVVAGIVVIVGIIAILTKSSCPFVYIQDGHAYHFMGEMYGGAIYSSLERNDFMPLPGFVPANGAYQLKISNELLERQYTNLAELMVVEHPDSSKVLLDKNGNVHTLLDPQSPCMATSGKNIDYPLAVAAEDNGAYLFNDENINSKELSNVELTFNKPIEAKNGKLVIKAKNSYWLDYVYGKFNEQFGTMFNAFSEAQKNVPAEKINKWTLEQGIPLSVYMETDEGWVFVDYFQVTGPLASREMILPIDVSKAKGDQVRLKLECGFMFWELDYAAMDFTEDIPVTVSNVAASTAIDQDGNVVSSLLAAADDTYLVQPDAGNAVVITYPAHAPKDNCRQSVFLHSKGYYEYIRDYRNVPDYLTLSSFRKEGAFAKFSKKQYYAYVSKPHLFEETITSNDAN